MVPVTPMLPGASSASAPPDFKVPSSVIVAPGHPAERGSSDDRHAVHDLPDDWQIDIGHRQERALVVEMRCPIQ